MYKTTKLNNGLRIVTNSLKDKSSVSIGIMVGVGGRYETDSNKGAAHFLEHIVFKGTKGYKCSQIKELIEGVGGTLNAYTSEEQTCFFAKIPAKHLDSTFDVLSDMVIQPRITPSDVAKEKTVIVEEIKMYKDIPQYFVHELIDGLLWPDHSLGKSLAGEPEIIMKMTNKDLKKFHGTHYLPANIVITACGKLSHDKIVALARKKFSLCRCEKEPVYCAANNTQNSPRINLFSKSTEQTHIALAALGYDKDHKDRYALSLLSTILGGNMSSRLFVELREKRGLAYSISCSSKNLDDTGAFTIRASVDNAKVVGAVKLILSELEKIKRNNISDGEFRRGKDYLLGQLLLGLEDTMDHMLWIGDSVLSKGRVKTIQRIVSEFKSIKKSDIKRVANDILARSRYNLAVVGPLSNSQKKDLKRLMAV